MAATQWTMQMGQDLTLPSVLAGTLVTIDLQYLSGTLPAADASTLRLFHIVYTPDPSPDPAGSPFRPGQDIQGIAAAAAINGGTAREFWIDLPMIWCPFDGQIALRPGQNGAVYNVFQTRSRCRRRPRDLIHRFSYYALVHNNVVQIPRGAQTYQVNANNTAHTLQRNEGGSAVITGAQSDSGTVGPWTQFKCNADSIPSLVFVICVGPDEVDGLIWNHRMLGDCGPWRGDFPVDPEAVGQLPDTLGYDPSLDMGVEFP
jgi:hypothetical protein